MVKKIGMALISSLCKASFIFFFDLETSMVKHGNATIDLTYSDNIKALDRADAILVKKMGCIFFVNLKGLDSR